MRKPCRVAIAWQELPAYAARLIKAGAELSEESIAVIGTRPTVPTEGMEAILGREIIWIEPEQQTTWAGMGLEIPKLFIHTGWSNTCFNVLGRAVKSHGGHVIGMMDNVWHRTARQMLGLLVFRLRLRPYFNALWVPGQAAHAYARMLGMPSSRIYRGMYGADPEIFKNESKLSARSKKMIFIGQYIERKGIGTLVEAFVAFRKSYPDWQLEVYGCGELEPLLRGQPGISVYGFQQSEAVAVALNDARCLILPSLREHWGLVVHEAALSGCGLILSRHVGAAIDLLGDANGRLVAARDSVQLQQAMEWAADLSEQELMKCSKESQSLAEGFGPAIWAQEFVKMIQRFA